MSEWIFADRKVVARLPCLYGRYLKQSAHPDFFPDDCGSGSTPLYISCQKGHADIVEYLLRRGANHQAKYMNKFTPLLVAAQHKNVNVVKTLLAFGLEPTEEEKKELNYATATIRELFFSP